MTLVNFLQRHPVFTGEELNSFLASEGRLGSRAQESLLAYYVKTSRVVRVRRGLFAVVPHGASPETFAFDPYLLTSRMTKDATLAYHTALEVHGKTYSMYERFTYLTHQFLRPVTFRSCRFKGVFFPKSLSRKGQESFNVVKIDRAGLEVRTTGLERTFVDVLHRPDLTGSWEEIWRSLETVEFFDLDKVTEYVTLLGNATTAAKVGFFLEQHRETLMVEDTHLKVLHDLRPLRPHYLERGRRKPGRFVGTWNLVIPEEIVNRSWEE
ncbi:MAG: transcriptional regulator [Deltaproteobacteria bacterium]|nr:transcriptional regulator [Deltaproteobacteria bacterium]